VKTAWVALLVGSMVACTQPPTPTLMPIPTLPPRTPTSVSVEPTAAPLAVEQTNIQPSPEIALVAPTPTVVQVAEVLPDAEGNYTACPANTHRVALLLPDGSPVSVISRIATDDGGRLFLLVDGGLYMLNRAAVDSFTLNPQMLIPLLLPGENASERPIQELSDLEYAPAEGAVYVLDKVGHAFRFDLSTNQVSLAYLAKTDSGQENDPEMEAIALDSDGGLLLLDSANGVVWKPRTADEIGGAAVSRALTNAFDLVASGDLLFALRKDGVLLRVTRGVGASAVPGSETRSLALSLKQAGDGLMVVDALERDVMLLAANGVSEVGRYDFAFSDIGLLRDAVLVGDQLYAVADGELLIFPGPLTSDVPCQHVTQYAHPLLYGADVLGLISQWEFPIPGEALPPWPRSYPGARRLYRMGVHHGVDMYGFGVDDGFTIGYPVLAIGAGEVVRSTVVYEPMSQEEWQQLANASEIAGFTADDALTRFNGKQVIVEHGNGIRSVYSHLDSIEPGVVSGLQVDEGELIGTVGVTGTLGESLRGAEAPHLHFEIWIGDRYLGYGLSMRETMWWIQEGFRESEAN